jgi:hypothetical protein
VAMIGGVLNLPRLPGVPGIVDYQGDTFHSSRWGYSITGGSPADPSLENLKDKVSLPNFAQGSVSASLQNSCWDLISSLDWVTDA